MSHPQRNDQTPQEADKTHSKTDRDAPLVFRPPAELPVLTKEASRALLALLIELTTTEVLDGPPEERRSDY